MTGRAGGVASDRFRTTQYGIESWHCFSAGPHYNPQRLGCGPVVGLDEHVVAPGAGFDWHAHRGVQIVSWVLEGTLRHEDERGEPVPVQHGRLLVQSTAGGIRHRETNPSPDVALRLVQLTVLGDSGPAAELVHGAAELDRARVRVAASDSPAAGDYTCTGTRLRYGGPAGEVLVVDFDPGSQGLVSRP